MKPTARLILQSCLVFAVCVVLLGPLTLKFLNKASWGSYLYYPAGGPASNPYTNTYSGGEHFHTEKSCIKAGLIGVTANSELGPDSGFFCGRCYASLHTSINNCRDGGVYVECSEGQCVYHHDVKMYYGEPEFDS